ncbi:MAG: VTT domain-containing protein [Candidatus Micrarchaeia archaeon]
MDPKKRRNRIILLIIGIIITATILYLSPSKFVEDVVVKYGYLGAFTIAFLSSSTVILPAPGLAGVFIMGAFLNPYLLGFCAGLGAALGELTGYMTGYGGKTLVEKEPLYRKIRSWMDKSGFITIFAFALIPNPVFDIVGIIAGVSEYPIKKFFVACLLGNILKAIMVAHLGEMLLTFL